MEPLEDLRTRHEPDDIDELVRSVTIEDAEEAREESALEQPASHYHITSAESPLHYSHFLRACRARLQARRAERLTHF